MPAPAHRLWQPRLFPGRWTSTFLLTLQEWLITLMVPSLPDVRWWHRPSCSLGGRTLSLLEVICYSAVTARFLGS